MEYSKRSESGQALLIVVLVMVVSLTIGLSVVSRSITNLRTTTDEEQSQRAFSAAEAGIEQALKTGVGIAQSTPLGNNASIKEVTVTQIGGANQFLLNGGNTVPKDSGADIWLSDNPTFANPKSPDFFSLYWGVPSDGDCTTAAAIEVIVISGATVNSSTSTRYAFDPCSSRGNSFAAPDTPSPYPNPMAGKTFKYRTTISGSDKIISGLIVRVVPLYANTIMAVYTCNSGGGNCTTLPIQAKKLESTGASGTTTRKITVLQGFTQLPAEFFQYVLFAP